MRFGPINVKGRDKEESPQDVKSSSSDTKTILDEQTTEPSEDAVENSDESIDSEDALELAEEQAEEDEEGAFARVSRFKTTAIQKLAPIGKGSINTLKSEGKDVKKLLSSKEVVIYKSDAIAILLRKSGGLIHFLDNYDTLIREGYVLSHQEQIDTFFEIPVAGIKTKLGKLYFFHHRKYTTSTTIPDPVIQGGLDNKQIASSFTEVSITVKNSE